MSRTDWYFSVIQRLASYRVLLFFIALIMVLGGVIAPHLNSPEQADQAMRKLYDSAPHYEWRLVEPHRPTR